MKKFCLYWKQNLDAVRPHLWEYCLSRKDGRRRVNCYLCLLEKEEEHWEKFIKIQWNLCWFMALMCNFVRLIIYRIFPTNWCMIRTVWVGLPVLILFGALNLLQRFHKKKPTLSAIPKLMWWWLKFIHYVCSKLINVAVPGTIDERTLNMKEKLNPWERSENNTLCLNSAKAIGCSVVNIGTQDLGDGRVSLILESLLSRIAVNVLIIC